MSRPIIISLRAVATAANEAAALLGGPAADVFEIDKPSRARLVAFAALARAYPAARQAEIAAMLGGWRIERRALQRLVFNARLSGWWRAHDVDEALDRIVGAIARDLVDAPMLGPDIAVAFERVAPAAAAAPILVANVRRSVTSRLLGDPPDAATRRAFLDSLPKHNADRSRVGEAF